ncbi:MAG: hypothetical protein V1898_04565 [Patescibacteria group bacterium]
MIYNYTRKKSAFYGALHGAAFSYYIASVAINVGLKFINHLDKSVSAIVNFLIFPDYFTVKLAVLLGGTSILNTTIITLGYLNVPALFFWSALGAGLGYLIPANTQRINSYFFQVYPKIIIIKYIVITTTSIFSLLAIILYYNYNEIYLYFALLAVSNLAFLIALQFVFSAVDMKYLKQLNFSVKENLPGAVASLFVIVILSLGVISIATLYIFLLS